MAGINQKTAGTLTDGTILTWTNIPAIGLTHCGNLTDRKREEGVAKERVQKTAAVGVTEHGNSAVLVTVASDGELLDRRRIDLTDSELPTLPHHHEGSWAVGRYKNSPWTREVSLPEAIELVERVRVSAAHGARESLEALSAAMSLPISRIAIRVCPSCRQQLKSASLTIARRPMPIP